MSVRGVNKPMSALSAFNSSLSAIDLPVRVRFPVTFLLSPLPCCHQGLSNTLWALATFMRDPGDDWMRR